MNTSGATKAWLYPKKVTLQTNVAMANPVIAMLG